MLNRARAAISANPLQSFSAPYDGIRSKEVLEFKDGTSQGFGPYSLDLAAFVRNAPNLRFEVSVLRAQPLDDQLRIHLLIHKDLHAPPH